MPNIQKQIDTLKAEITRLENEQQRAKQEEQALNDVSSKITSILKESGVSFESYITLHSKRISKILSKLESKNGAKTTTLAKKAAKTRSATKPRKANKPNITVKIPAGRYSKLPSQPEMVFEVKEKGPRPKALKAYAEEVGLETFLDQCRLN
jgi:uncharacterized phage infection (PIP) family protein YhgE